MYQKATFVLLQYENNLREKENWTLRAAFFLPGFSICTSLQYSSANKVLVMYSCDTSPRTLSNVYAIWLRGKGTHLFSAWSRSASGHPSQPGLLFVCVCSMCCCYLITLQHHNMGQSTTVSVIVLSSNSPKPLLFCSLLTHKLTGRIVCMLEWVLKKKKRIIAVAFYDDITTVSDICVMAVSRLRVENEAPGDIVSDVLWRDSHIQKERKRGRESWWQSKNQCVRVSEGAITSSHFMAWLADTRQLLYLPFYPTILFFPSNEITQGQWWWWQHFIELTLTLSSLKCTILYSNYMVLSHMTLPICWICCSIG